MVCPGLGGPEAPAGEKNFAFSGAKTSKSLKKSGAARAMKTILAMKNEDSALDYEKSEDPAKITYSILPPVRERLAIECIGQVVI